MKIEESIAVGRDTVMPDGVGIFRVRALVRFRRAECGRIKKRMSRHRKPSRTTRQHYPSHQTLLWALRSNLFYCRTLGTRLHGLIQSKAHILARKGYMLSSPGLYSHKVQICGVKITNIS